MDYGWIWIAICIVVIPLWCVASDMRKSYQAECRRSLELAKEVGGLIQRAEAAERKLRDNPAGTNYAKIMGTVRRWALEGRISHEEADEIREWIK